MNTATLDRTTVEQTAPPRHDAPVRARVAYVLSRFPKLTETFVLFEMKELERQGVAVEIFPLLRARNTGTHPEGASLWRKARELFCKPATNAVMHEEARPYVERAHFTPLLGAGIAWSNLLTFARQPLTYLRTLTTLVRANWGSRNYLLGGLLMFPKSVDLARRMQRVGITHVHAHFASHPTTTAFVVHRLTGIPYTFTAHGADIHVDQHMLPEKLDEAAAVVAISRDNVRFLAEHGGREFVEKIEVVHCGVDVSVFRPREWTPEDRAERGTVERPLRITCIGTLYEVKGQRHLVEACRLLAERGRQVRCHLVGDGEDLAALRQQAVGAGLGEQVVFEGRRTRTEIADLLQRTDVLVTPSVVARDGRREGIPVVLMEGMASGLPVVASRLSGIPELVEDDVCGLLVEPGNADAIATALERLAADPVLRRDLGEAARAKVLAEFDLETNARRLAALILQQKGTES